MSTFEQKIKERNNLLKSQVESLTGRNEMQEIVETLLKAGVSEEDLVEKAKYIRREGAPGNYKYIYEEPKELSDKDKRKIGAMGGKEGGHIAELYKKLKKKNKQQSEESKTDKVDKKEERKQLEKERSDNRKSYENKEIDYDTYSKNERKINRKFEKVLKKSESSDLEKTETDKKKKKVAKVMKEWKEGTLKTSAGEKVTDQKQAIAIAMSEAGMSVKKSAASEILKSHLGEFSYSEKLGIKKTGKEIKEKFKLNLDKEKSELNELKSKMSILKTKIGEEPAKRCDYWGLEAYEDKGLDIPMVYDYFYGELKADYTQAETQILIGETPKVENVSKLRNEYNDLVRKYIDCQKEIMQINTILNNYKDTDIYQLTISQATVLGF